MTQLSKVVLRSLAGSLNGAIPGRGRRVRKRFKDASRLQTGRSDGRILGVIIQSVHRRVRGWVNYFWGGVRCVSIKPDRWLRLRLRSIMRHSEKCGGRAKECDLPPYPNARFTRAGLIFLTGVTHSDSQPGERNEHLPALPNWRAECGKFERPVRRRGGAIQRAIPPLILLLQRLAGFHAFGIAAALGVPGVYLLLLEPLVRFINVLEVLFLAEDFGFAGLRQDNALPLCA